VSGIVYSTVPMLTFATSEDRQQAEQLMQPTLIRVIDNLRKQTEVPGWQSEYVERVLWPASATEAEKQQVKDLAAQLETADSDRAADLRRQLSHLPAPVPTYEVRLTHEGATSVMDVWQLCFRVCFWDYDQAVPVQVDQTLLDSDGEVDWIALDEKAKDHVTAVLEQLTTGNQTS
jgi:hypothetical protein